MTITSILFLFLFLPISLCLFFVVRNKNQIKEFVLFIISLIFYACGSSEYFILFIISIGINIVIGRKISTLKDTKLTRKIFLIFGIVLDVGVLAYYKYSDFTFSTIAGFWGGDFEVRNILAPLGISFFTFKEISYLVDIYNGKAVLNADPVHDVLYLSFFPQIQSGPISRYNDMKSADNAQEITRMEKLDFFSDGVSRFMIGFNKKILLADTLSHITAETFSAGTAEMSVGYAWLGAVCFSLQLYYDFSGYSDMAIGLTKMFGYTCPENFNYPYFTESVSRFWRRWHISLGTWFRDYVYIPLGGSRVGSKLHMVLNLFMVWLLTGIWHGSDLSFIIWGLGYFIFISFEKLTGYPDRFKFSISKFIYRIFVLLFINFQWVIFHADSLEAGVGYIKRMFVCPENPLADSRTFFLIKDNFIFIVCAVIFAFPVIPYIKKKMSSDRYQTFIWETVFTVINLLLFIWAISFVVAGVNNPFAYANF